MEFELPEIGKKALEFIEQVEEEDRKTRESEEEEEQNGRDIPDNVASVDDMAKILEKQAMKIHEQAPARPVVPGKKEDQKPPPRQKMIINLGGSYAGQIAASPQPKKEELPKTAGEYSDLLDFLDESIKEYEKYVDNIGRNGLAAVNLGYYRDDIQDVLDMLKFNNEVKLRPYWEKIVKIDLKLRGKASMYVREVGYENFKQYQIINDPPLVRWWWYLNKQVAPPIQQAKFWDIWK